MFLFPAVGLSSHEPKDEMDGCVLVLAELKQRLLSTIISILVHKGVHRQQK